jgi:Flp pilus assembly protein CpaB
MQLATRVVSTRRGALVAALLVATIAGASILLYLSSYRKSLRADGTPVTVLVARDIIPKGTSGSVLASKGLYTATTVRESQLLEGAISDPATLREKVSTREIYAGAQLTASDFVAGDSALAGRLSDRQRVISVPLDSAHGLIDGIEVGNRVDVYAGFNVIPLGADGRPIEGGQARPVLRLIMQDVPVVAVGEKASGSGTTNVSLGVDDRQAAQVAFASDNGKLWLTLRPGAGAAKSRPGIVTVETLLLGVPPVNIINSLGGRR